MRLLDADEAKKQVNQMQTLKTSEKILLRLALDRTPTYEPPNDPLTLEQLREMDGEPVWAVQTSGELRPFWMLVDTEDESAANRLYAALFEDYGTEWLAYRHKPKEGAP